MKAMFKFLLLMLVLVSVSSCKTTKSSLNEQKSSNVIVKNDTKEMSSSADKTRTLEILADKSTSADSVVKSTVVVSWSKPDSAGVQHPTTTTYINETHTLSKKADINSSIKTNANVLSKNSKEDNSKLKTEDSDIIKSNDESETQNPNYMNWGIGIGVLVLGAIVYFVLRRIGLV